MGECYTCNDPNCVTCERNFVCGTCLNSTFKISPNGMCVICPDPNCVSCTVATPDVCVNCINALYTVN